MAKKSAPPKVYLAGPDVFLRNAKVIGALKVEICARYGLAGKFPLDTEIDLSGLTLAEQGYAIARANEALMRACDAAVANLTPFRGVGMDVGTAYEIGFMRGLGKPLFGYTNSHLPHFDRMMKFEGGKLRARGGKNPVFLLEDAMKMGVEDHGFAENLMIEGAIHESGADVVAGKTHRADRYTDLVAFETCVKQAAEILLHKR